jgi:hypothetical protein
MIRLRRPPLNLKARVRPPVQTLRRIARKSLAKLKPLKFQPRVLLFAYSVLVPPLTKLEYKC